MGRALTGDALVALVSECRQIESREQIFAATEDWSHGQVQLID